MIQVHLQNPHTGGRGQLELKGRQVTTEARGQESRSFEFLSEAKAQHYFRRRLRSWQARGYLAGHQDLELLRAIAADPENDDLRLVYGDWLQEQGDPRGELIAMQASPADLGRFAESRFVDRHRWTLFGCEAKHLQVDWRLGFADALRFSFSAEEHNAERMIGEIRCVLRNPTSFFVRGISIEVPQHPNDHFWQWQTTATGRGEMLLVHELIEEAAKRWQELVRGLCLQEIELQYPYATDLATTLYIGHTQPVLLQSRSIRDDTPRFAVLANPPMMREELRPGLWERIRGRFRRRKG